LAHLHRGPLRHAMGRAASAARPDLSAPGEGRAVGGQRSALGGPRPAAAEWNRARSRADDDAGAAPAGIPGGGDRPVRQDLDRVRAAEEEIAAPPADDVVACRLDFVELGGVEPALAMQMRLVDVDARRIDRVRDAELVLDDV